MCEAIALRFLFVKRLCSLLIVLALAGLLTAKADENVRAAQDKLRTAGFYFEDPSGVYDSATSAAVTRFQIRNGLAISGQLDAATAKALGVSAPQADPRETPANAQTWRRLRQSDEQFLKRLNQGKVEPPAVPAEARPRPALAASPNEAQVGSKPTAPPVREAAPAATPPPRPARQRADYRVDPERLRDYVAAFVLAGLDRQVGAELEFFGDRVNYFGERGVSREKIRKDLIRYDQRWPQRRFFLAGELEVDRQSNGLLRVTFPLRYELRSPTERSSGRVLKTITLKRVGPDDLEIVAVDERKAK